MPGAGAISSSADGLAAGGASSDSVVSTRIWWLIKKSMTAVSSGHSATSSSRQSSPGPQLASSAETNSRPRRNKSGLGCKEFSSSRRPSRSRRIRLAVTFSGAFNCRLANCVFSSQLSPLSLVVIIQIADGLNNWVLLDYNLCFGVSLITEKLRHALGCAPGKMLTTWKRHCPGFV